MRRCDKLFWVLVFVSIMCGCAHTALSSGGQERLDQEVKKQIEIGKDIATLTAQLANVMRDEGDEGTTVKFIVSEIRRLKTEEVKIFTEIADIKATEKATFWGMVWGGVGAAIRGVPSKGPLGFLFPLLGGLMGRRKEQPTG